MLHPSMIYSGVSSYWETIIVLTYFDYDFKAKHVLNNNNTPTSSQNNVYLTSTADIQTIH